MALLTDNNNYVKLINTDNTINCIIYPSLEHRNTLKELLQPEEIIEMTDKVIKKKQVKVETLIKKYNIKTIEDLNYYLKDKPQIKKDFEYAMELSLELNTYKNEVALGNGHSSENDYRLLKEIYKDVEKTVPIIISKVNVMIKGDTLEEMYSDVKNSKRFGDTTDC